jgi:hypothetical protein
LPSFGSEAASLDCESGAISAILQVEARDAQHPTHVAVTSFGGALASAGADDIAVPYVEARLDSGL